MDSSTKRLWHLVILASIAGSLGGEEKTDKGEKQEKEARKDGPKLRLEARGQDSRIDLAWSLDESPEPMGFVVERGERPDGPFVRLHGELHEPTVYSDFIGENGRTLYYRVSAVDGQGRAQAAS